LQFHKVFVYAFDLRPHLYQAIEKGGLIEVNELEAQDIDTETDWKIAELKYQIMKDSE